MMVKDDYQNIKLIDLGTSQELMNSTRKLKEINMDGTPYYYSPELLNGKMTKKIDIW
jgi:serine/threonine protein kinase